MEPDDESSRQIASEDKTRLLHRLARAEGQIRGVQKMIVREEDCELIARQLAAVRAALNKAFFEMLACYFEHKVGGTAAEEPMMREELSDFVKLLTKYA